MAKGRNDLERVAAATAGDSAAFGRVFDRWFDRVGDLVWRIVRNRDTASEVAQASFVAAWEQRDTLSRPEDFGPWLLRLSRRQALDRLEHDRRPSAAGLTLSRRERSAASSAAASESGPGSGTDDGAGDADQVVWAAYTALGEREASLLDLHLRHDVPAAALATDLDVPADEAALALEHQRSRLVVALRAWGLRAAGTERCPGLTDALAASGGATHFGESVRVIAAHAVGCAACSEAQEALPDPELQFAAVPVAAAPVAMRAQAAAGLQAAGIEVGTAFSRSKPTGEVERVQAPAPVAPPSSPPPSSQSSASPAPPPAPTARPEPPTARPTMAQRLAARGASAGGSTPKPRSLDDFRGGSAYGSAAVSGGSGGSGVGDATAVSPAPDADSTTSEPVAPSSSSSPLRSQQKRRRLVLGAAAALVLLIGLTGVALSAGGSGEDDHRVESGAPRPENDGPFAGSDLGVDGPVVDADDDPSAPDDGDRSTTTLPGATDQTLPNGETIPPGSGGVSGGTGGTSGGSGGTTVPGDPDDPQVPPGTPTSTTEPDDTPSETTTTTVATTTPPPARAPEITSFRGTVTGTCGLLGLGRAVSFTWHSTGANSAGFGPRGGSTTAVEPNGGVTRCAAIGTVFQLSVSGPGGSDTATATVPA